jgi:hypothetical protein
VKNDALAFSLHQNGLYRAARRRRRRGESSLLFRGEGDVDFQANNL